jgi:hypothetical protein
MAALESTNGRQGHHTHTGLHVYCEWALKGAGTRGSGGAGAGNRPREKEVYFEGCCGEALLAARERRKAASGKSDAG